MRWLTLGAKARQGITATSAERGWVMRSAAGLCGARLGYREVQLPQPQPPPQQPPPPPPAGAAAPDERPPRPTVVSSLTVSSWPWGQGAGSPDWLIGRVSRNVSP